MSQSSDTRYPDRGPTPSPDRAGMTARWERSDDGASWQPWMDMTFTRTPN